MSLEKAIEDFKKGNFVLIHDSKGRENEVDLVMLTEFVKPESIATMRMDGGGMICAAVHPKIANNFGIPYLTEVYEFASKKFKILTLTRANDIPYDERSAFSLAVNHRKTFTGITDSDRALTISQLGKMGARAMRAPVAEEFGKSFRSPGHVPLLRAADGLLKKRKGHTELTVAFAELAGKTPVTALCEMMDAGTKKALSIEKARRYSERKGLELVSGSEIVEAWMEAVGK